MEGDESGQIDGVLRLALGLVLVYGFWVLGEFSMQSKIQVKHSLFTQILPLTDHIILSSDLLGIEQILFFLALLLCCF